MGSISNGYAPFQINYVYHKNTIFRPRTRNKQKRKTPYGPPVIACDKEARPGLGTCSCTDCESACSVPDFPWKKKDRSNDPNFIFPYYYGLDIWSIATIAVFTLILLLFVIISIYSMTRKAKVDISSNKVHPRSSDAQEEQKNGEIKRNIPIVEEASNDNSQNSSCKIGVLVNRALEYIFARCGTFCANHPIPVIVIDLAIIGVLCSGLALLRITTDPIELWAAPNSRSRLERDFFGATFRPFYRTEQIIITTKKANTISGGELEPFNYTNLFGKNTTFGPVFHKKFLLEVLRLQKEIEALKVPYVPLSAKLG